jgi:hypothetical protein
MALVSPICQPVLSGPRASDRGKEQGRHADARDHLKAALSSRPRWEARVLWIPDDLAEVAEQLADHELGRWAAEHRTALATSP